MVSLDDLNALTDESFVATLGGIYEHSDWVPRYILGRRPFPSLARLVAEMRLAVDVSNPATKRTLIERHPDLAGKLARSGKLTKLSTMEQTGLGLDRLSEEEYTIFSDLNQRYREKFGFPFVICARLTTRKKVIDAFHERLEHSYVQEIESALAQIHEIARLRLVDLIDD